MMQVLATIQQCLDEIERNLDRLSALGHPLHLEHGPVPNVELERWPRWVFFSDGRSRQVFHPQDLLELGSGWYDTLEEAKHRAGVEAQWAGRGGVGKSGLPMALRARKDGG